MRALVIREFGDPKKLKIEEVPTPRPDGNSVLVAVHSASINPSDVKNVGGTMHGTTLPRIPGRDFAGVVTAGPEELIGREVFGTGGDLGFTRDGTHAEFVFLPRSAITTKPATLSMELAGAAGLTFVTAWSAIVIAGNAGPGDTVLVLGAAGGVGSAAVQIAKARKSRVIGVVRSDHDMAFVRQMGADHVLNSKSVKIVDAVHEITSNRGSDVVFDSTGMMFSEAIESAAMQGRVLVISAPKDGMANFNLRTLYRKVLRVEGVDTRRMSAVDCAPLLREMSRYFESGQFKPLSVESFPLERGVEAYVEAFKGGRRIVLRARN